jgi:hypothetical protein
MQDTPEFRAYFRELQISIDAALAIIDLVSQHDIVGKQDFQHVTAFIDSAAEAIDKMKVLQMVEDRHLDPPMSLPQNRGIGRAPLRVVRG